MVESFLIKSYGNVLLKKSARKNSYSENFQDEKMCRESSFWVSQPKTFKFFTNKVFHYSGCILLADQYGWDYILLPN